MGCNLKILKLKGALIVLLIFLFISVSLPYLMPVRTAFSDVQPQWGESFKSGSGKTICVCFGNECYPCVELPGGES